MARFVPQRLQNIIRWLANIIPWRLTLKEEEERRRSLTSEELKKVRGELNVLEEIRSRLEKRNQTLEQERLRLEDSSKREVEERIKTEAGLQREREEKSAAQAVLQRSKTETASLQRQLEVQERESKGTKNELQHLKLQHTELTSLLETRTRELKGAQAFLTKADSLSGADVIKLVEGLNSEILQTAAFISDSFDFDRSQANAEEMKEASSRISELMGATMTRYITTMKHGDDPLIVQIALQAAMVEFTRWMAMTWDYDSLQAEQPLAEIYNDIREGENQAVAGRWRALTRAHAQKIAFSESDLHGTMVAHVSDTLVVVMVSAGCTKNYEESYRTFTMKFGERVSNVVKMATRLNKAMGQEVTSADLWLTHAGAGENFDATSMEDLDGLEGGDKPQAGVVLCTTGLGLQRSEKVTKDDVVDFKNTPLLKPRVALESVAEGMDRDA
ncbi:hypothetical protein BJ138DRAFT_1003876 [Hygrophoropsis aurantiaca]|uniref:Uncharacterized protein n=1 Tax=Hygrophoropsis aurantiaca TaxID=72124 RepID=A0ACB8AHP7_9AGAM|nr:hypothetical protein BJ138DRAFT_1003876 [Hygrophoropsis aurantiaca]